MERGGEEEGEIHLHATPPPVVSPLPFTPLPTLPLLSLPLTSSPLLSTPLIPLLSTPLPSLTPPFSQQKKKCKEEFESDLNEYPDNERAVRQLQESYLHLPCVCTPTPLLSLLLPAPPPSSLPVLFPSSSPASSHLIPFCRASHLLPRRPTPKVFHRSFLRLLFSPLPSSHPLYSSFFSPLLHPPFFSIPHFTP